MDFSAYLIEKSRSLDLTSYVTLFFCPLLLFCLFIYFLEREREGERVGEEHQYVVASHAPPTGDLARNPGMCPDWELNQ